MALPIGTELTDRGSFTGYDAHERPTAGHGALSEHCRLVADRKMLAVGRLLVERIDEPKVWKTDHAASLMASGCGSFGARLEQQPEAAMTRTEVFLKRLQEGQVLMADGATGTMLQDNGLELGKVPESWLFERPNQVLALHKAYLEAGSDIILTCSFGGTRYRLRSDGLAGRVVEVNLRAAELAREAAGADAYVAGDMGPTGQLLAPLGQATVEEVADAFALQAEGLSAGGADFLLIETMSDLGEARAAIEGARRVTDLPVFCTFSFDTHGRTMMGLSPRQVALEIGPIVQGFGANCGNDPAEFPAFLQEMRQAAPAMVLCAKPNAGLPRIVGDQVVYDADPEYMAEIARKVTQAGAQIVGGCCGTTPAHISAMTAALRNT